ncbi:MAG: HypC/HybG/HupF family hydrogenase formation chaperone [Acetobacteraceae bacterium]
MCLAIPGLILSITGDDPLMREARVSFGGLIRKVNIAFVPDAVEGDYVLVHAGFGIAIVDAEAAEKTLDLLASAPTEPSS